MPDLPSGTVAFLFTDIEGSTARWERDQVAMQAAVKRHLAILREAVAAHGGVLFKVVGDATQSAFATAPDAVAAATQAQQALVQEFWSSDVGSLRLRMALHAGQAAPQDGDYLAAPLNRLSRLLAAGHGGQILFTEVVERLCAGTFPEDVRLRPLGTHRLRDLHEPEQVFQVVAPGLPETFPVLHSLPASPTNLVTPLTGLIGREGELAVLRRWLTGDGARLVTLTGAGGTGKTRLAVEVATEALDRFADGVFFVDLSPLSDPGLVVPAIAATLGVSERTEQPLLDTLVGFLAAKHLLLVLDNCERVLDAAPDVSTLLAGDPVLAVLATSREALHLRGEREMPLLPLPLPEVERLPAIEELARVPAVALFVERATASQPNFALTADNAAAVAAICRRLDGLPLAIELAAARVKVLPPDRLLARLEHALPLLIGGARDAPQRQRTLRDTITWSHDLLSPGEQRLFRALGVFVGGWTLEAAEAVAAPEKDLDTLEGLTSLADKSLVWLDERGPAPRFHMLQTVREFTSEQLAASGDERPIRERHAAWCLALAEEALPDLDAGRAEALWYSRLDAELDNLRVALAWFADAGEHVLLLRLLAGIWRYWTSRPYHAEVRRWLEPSLRAAPDAPVTVRAAAHELGVVIAGFLGDHVAAAAHADASLAAARALDDPLALGRAHFNVGLAWAFAGDLARAAASYAESLPLVREAGAAVFISQTLGELGDTYNLMGDAAGAVSLLDEALELNRRIDYPWGIAVTLGQRAHAALLLGDPALASRLFAESIATAEEIGEARVVMGAIAGLAGVALARGQPERAVRLLGAVEAARESSGIGRISHAPYAERITADTRAALEAEAFEQSWSAGQALPLERTVAEALALAAEVAAGARG